MVVHWQTRLIYRIPGRIQTSEKGVGAHLRCTHFQRCLWCEPPPHPPNTAWGEILFAIICRLTLRPEIAIFRQILDKFS